MVGGRFDVVVRHLRQLAEPSGGEPSDGELLDRCTAQRDADALDALVRRHGALVLGVCRRVLGNSADADDAFQATFLVLIRRARSLSSHGSLAAWLWTVARRLALRARVGADRRRRQEQQAPARSPADPLAEVSGRELCALLDEELARLPERYRAPLLLCCLEGRTRDEAAESLGWTVGALKGRLERGRELLRRRLAKRGLDLSTVLLAATAGALPTGAVRAAVASALRPAPAAAALADGLLRSLAAFRFRMTAVLLLLLGALTAGMGLVSPAEPPLDVSGRFAPPPAAAPKKPEPLPKVVEMPLRHAEVAVRLGSPRFREGEGLHALACSPDGKLVACANQQGTHVRLWDLSTGKVACVLEGHQSSIVCVAFAPDGKTLAAAGGADLHLRLWDIATRRELRRFPAEGMPHTLAFSPDGKTLLAGGYHLGPRLWEVATGKELRRFTWQRGSVLCAAFSPDGKLVAAGGDDERLRLFEAATGKVVPGPELPAGPTWSLAFAPDGKTVAVGGRKGELFVCDVAARRTLASHDFHRWHWLAVAYSPDGHTLACAGADGMVRLWDDGLRGRPLVFAAGQGPIRSISFTPGGKTLLTAGEGSVRVWDVATGKDRFPDEGHHGPVAAVAFSPDGRLLASAGKDRTIRLWDVDSGKERAVLAGHQDAALALAFTPDGKTLLSTGDIGDSGLRLWDVAAARERRQVKAEPARRHFLALAPAGGLLVAADRYPKVGVWDTATWKVVRQLEGHTFAVTTAAVSPDGKYVVTGSEGWHVRLWDTATGQPLRTFKMERPATRQVAFSPDGKLLAAGNLTEPCRFWEVATGKEVSPALGNPGRMFVTFSPDGRLVASAGEDDSLRLWEFATGQELYAQPMRPEALAFAPDGRRLAVGRRDCSVVLLEVPGVIQGMHAGPLKLGAAELARLWQDLGGPDARQAWRSVGRLAAAPGQTVAFLRERLGMGSTAPKAGTRVRQLVEDLGHVRFALREQASKELAKLGSTAEPALRAALAKAPAEEVRRRINQLLAALTPRGTSAERLAASRALAALEQLGTPEAVAVLRETADRARENGLRREARAAVERLARRGPP